jgi:hypothetical protein
MGDRCEGEKLDVDSVGLVALRFMLAEVLSNIWASAVPLGEKRRHGARAVTAPLLRRAGDGEVVHTVEPGAITGV